MDLHYPEHLHDLHANFPLAPIKEETSFSWLGEYRRKALELLGVKTFSTKKNKTLIQRVYDKSSYTLHYLTLKLYCELGLEVRKIHRLLRFDQSKWRQTYIRLNTRKRKTLANNFEEKFH